MPEEQQQWDEFREQERLLRERVLPAMGISVYQQEGYEADDLIASAAVNVNAADTVVILSTDKDLYQCISGSVSWFSPQGRKLMTEPDVFVETGVWPAQWAAVKALAGCSSDNIKGIPGVGEKTAARHFAGVLTGKRRALLDEETVKKYMNQNCPLTLLPFHDTVPVVPIDPVYCPERFFLWCERLGFESWLHGGGRRKWENFFRGRFQDSESRPVHTRRRSQAPT